MWKEKKFERRRKRKMFLLFVLFACSLAEGQAKLAMTISCDKETCNVVQPGCDVANQTNIHVKELLEISEGLTKKIRKLERVSEKFSEASMGTSFCNSGKSCRHIKMVNPQADDGEYWVDIDQPRKVYCDMTTDGGGWMLVSNIVSETTQGQAWSLAKDFKKISEYSSNSLGLSTSALASLQNHINFDKLRFFCHKKVPGRTINIATKNNTVGKAAVRFLTGRTDPFPTACGSYDKMADDNSFISQQCSQWGHDGAYRVNKWSHSSVLKAERLFNHPFFLPYSHHWIVPLTKGGRWECDDYQGTISVGDTWQIFTR